MDTDSEVGNYFPGYMRSSGVFLAWMIGWVLLCGPGCVAGRSKQETSTEVQPGDAGPDRQTTKILDAGVPLDGDALQGGASRLNDVSLEQYVIRRSVCLDEPPSVSNILVLGAVPTGFDGAGRLDEQKMECILAAKNCEDVLACEGIFVNEECTGPWAPMCDGNTVVSCVATPLGNLPRRLDCAESVLGQYCLVGKGGLAMCGDAECKMQSWEGTSTCSGDLWSKCFLNVQTVFDCALMGMKCVSSLVNEDAAICSNGKECSGTHCAAEYLQLCSEGYMIGTVDCLRFGEDFDCLDSPWWLSTGPGAQCGLPKQLANCDPLSTRSSCFGDSVVVCMFGKPLELPCNQFLGATCQEDDSASPSAGAKCVANDIGT